MLILSRGVGETITIGHTIRVKVLAIKGTQVRLGIEAPKDMRVLRDEIAESSSEKATEGGEER